MKKWLFLLIFATACSNEPSSSEEEPGETPESEENPAVDENNETAGPEEEPEEENNESPAEEPEETVIAETSAGTITEEAFTEALREEYGEELLSRMIQDLAFEQEAERLGIEEEDIEEEINSVQAALGSSSEEEFYQMMELQGIAGEEDLRRRVLQQLVLTERAGSQETIDEETLQAEYDAGEEVEARHILVSTEEEAEVILEELENGADFAALAEENSQDPGSAEEGGDLGSFGRGTMAPPFERAAFSLENDEISDPVESTFGYHIIQVTGRTPFSAPFEEVREELLTALNERLLYEQNRVQEEIVSELDVTIRDESLQGADTP
ncbi:peptidylprolyl isomerase [Alkalicoccus urumqiensis]|uniref:PpiC domain-containing protein n=1 Tax=Alkalicoccus urumqiensis TaxID=1548213 RepID=A0A2P6MFA3_ALKUR|nr:peptidylprolyl isomerase [Alkalicoccus urumqiensis]PRO64982.1 hypothetical protein C6I21_11050 [Alkalicoccus urumqiensis]